MQHLDDGLIQEIIDGEIPSRDLVPLQAHLAGCDACRHRLDVARMAATEADELLLMLDEAEPAAAVADPVVLPIRRNHWSRNLAWAASLVLAVGLGYASRDVLNPIVPTPSAVQEATRDTRRAPNTEQSVGASGIAPTATAPLPEGPASSRIAQQDVAAQDPAAPAAAQDARRDQANATPPVGALRAPESAPREQFAPPAAPVTAGSGVGSAEEGARQRALSVAEREGSDSRAERRLTQPAPSLTNRAAGRSLELADAAKALGAAREVDLPTAMQLLGGSIKLIDGLVPQRLDAAGNQVTVVYRLFWGELLLTQRREGERLEWDLVAPRGLPADSLTVLRGKVRP